MLGTCVRHLLLSMAFVLTVAMASRCPAQIVRMSTNLGDIDIRLYPELAPNSVANFRNYVRDERYDDTFIHRVPPNNFVVQGGAFQLNGSIFDATAIATDDPIGDEFNVSNTRGTIAMAKNSLGATSQWFFNLGDNSFLDDDDFTVIGRVVGDGMDVVDAINALDTVNASVAEDAPGEDFDELPVLDLEKVQNQSDVFEEDAVVISSVFVRPLLRGDYNFDGDVDAADYTLWKDTLGSTVRAEADGNGDGVIDSTDYAVWKNNYGRSSEGSAVGVPEPTAGFLSLLACFGSASRRRRRA